MDRMTEKKSKKNGEPSRRRSLGQTKTNWRRRKRKGGGGGVLDNGLWQSGV